MEAAVRHLQYSIQALAQSPEIQRRLFPAFVVLTDELALEFENWCAAALPFLSPTGTQRDALVALVAGLDEVEYDEALAGPSWERVRALTRAAIAAFGWRNEPPAGFLTYVRG